MIDTENKVATDMVSVVTGLEKISKYIYIGPNLKSGKLIKYSIYKGLPIHIDTLLTAMPEIVSLFVPIDKLVEAEREVAMVGSPRNKYYKMAMEVE